LFLDRDGVINVEKKDSYVLNISEFIFSAGAQKAIKTLSEIFGLILIVSNQRGVSKGVMSLEDLHDVHAYMLEAINQQKGRIDKIYFCTDMDSSSPNRKPNPGMALQAKKDFPQIASIKMHLHKVIPVGGGLGGGSSDAAFTIRLLDQEFDLGLTTGKLIAYALELGSDCPFFIINEPCYAAGRGELLETIQLDLSAWKFVVVHPRIQVDTSLAYSQISPSPSTRSIKEIIQQPPETWKTELKNDFEPVIFKQHPAIKTIKEELYQSGAVYSSLSGSGSSVFGLFSKKQEMQLNFPPNYFVKELLG